MNWSHFKRWMKNIQRVNDMKGRCQCHCWHPKRGELVNYLRASICWGKILLIHRKHVSIQYLFLIKWITSEYKIRRESEIGGKSPRRFQDSTPKPSNTRCKKIEIHGSIILASNCSLHFGKDSENLRYYPLVGMRHRVMGATPMEANEQPTQLRMSESTEVEIQQSLRSNERNLLILPLLPPPLATDNSFIRRKFR